MSDSNEMSEEDELATLRDRLADLALGEISGGETPPDLTQSILANANQVEVMKMEKEFSRRSLVVVAITVCVLALASPWMLQKLSKNAASNIATIESNRGVQFAKNDDVDEPAVPGSNSNANIPFDAVSPGSGYADEIAKSIESPFSTSKSVDAKATSGRTDASDLFDDPDALEEMDEEMDEGMMGGGMGYGSGGGGYGGGGNSADGGYGGGGGYGTAPGAYGGGGGGYGGMPAPSANRSRYQARGGRGRNGQRDYYGYGEQSSYGNGRRASGGDQYSAISENQFIEANGGDAVSTFSIDIDTASFTNTRQMLLSGQIPPPDSVRIEEFVNYFSYNYETPTDDKPFAANIEVATCPWQPSHRLVRIGLKGKEISRSKRPKSNLVFLIDVSGSMDDPNKLPLVQHGLKQLTRELGENDRVAIVVYASQQGLLLPSTRGSEKQKVLRALADLNAGGSTAGGAGIQLAYKIAKENFIKGGTNRVILCTDGDFNVGVTDTNELERLAEQKAKSGVFLTVLGFGRGNLNDAMMERISNKGNGNYHYIDSQIEARKVLVREMSGTLVTIAKDVKIQVEFNPARVKSYRLIGYENRMLATEDFNDDTKDAGEIGAGHTVTALYEIVPAAGTASVEPLKYQPVPTAAKVADAENTELLELRFRYKEPNSETSKLLKFPVTDKGKKFDEASEDFRFAASVVSFGMLLRQSEYRGTSNYGRVLKIARESSQSDEYGYRATFEEMVRNAGAMIEGNLFGTEPRDKR